MWLLLRKDRGCYKRSDIVQVFKDDKPVVRPMLPPAVTLSILVSVPAPPTTLRIAGGL